MVIVGRVERGAYFDSVTLMDVARQATGVPGLIDVALVMGTTENKAVLGASGLLTPDLECAAATDLLISVRADTDHAAGEALQAIRQYLREVKRAIDSEEQFRPISIGGALEVLPGANLALVSVAGRYAADEARKAIEAGLHVMLFSDNVSIEDEIELKVSARQKDLLVMGPDCGSAIINGVPLAFANVVRRGDIGIVAASGTGLQEVSAIVSNEGAGISQAIGTGGRDVRREVGGIMFVEALNALAGDDATKVIVLISKPPDPEVLDRIRAAAHPVEKPIIPVLLGSESGELGEISTLEHAALTAVALSRGWAKDEVARILQSRANRIRMVAEGEAARRRTGQRYLRGLMSGGTFCAEAQIVLTRMISDLYSNAPTGTVEKSGDPLRSQANSVIDLGADEFTIGRPHPMIDYSLRNRRILEEAGDPETAVILLDIVLGYGANPDPAAELAGVIREACGNVAIVCSITGTNRDPQNRDRTERALLDAGAIVMPSNASASMLAGSIVQLLGEN